MIPPVELNITPAPTAAYNGHSADVKLWGRIFNLDTLQQPPSANPAAVVHDTFAAHGIRGLGRIDGSFLAVVVTKDATIVARDRHGTGLQFYYSRSHYATSLRDMLILEPGSMPPDVDALASFLVEGIIATPRSSVRGVKKLAAGHALVIGRDGSHQTVALDDYGQAPQVPATEADIIERYGQLHIEAIRRRIGPGPAVVGMLLSGGYDSGSNLAALRQCYDGEVRTYSIGFKGDEWTELPLARLMSRHFGTRHTEYEIDGTEVLDLPQIVESLGDPFVEGGLMVNYAAMRLAAGEQLPVILGGDGSDQYFGTAGRELALLHIARRAGVLPLLRIARRWLDGPADGSTATFKAWFRLASISGALDGDAFGFTPQAAMKLVAGSKVAATAAAVPDGWEKLYMQHRSDIDIARTINQVILFKASRMAEMMGNTIAFPFTDLQLFNYLNQLPASMMCRGGSVMDIARGRATAKYILKARYKPLLPPEVTSKKKQGGFAPMPIFFSDSAIRHRLADFILSSSACDALLDRHGVEQFLRHYDTTCGDHGRWFWLRQNEAIKYFSILTLATWWEIFVNHKTVDLR